MLLLGRRGLVVPVRLGAWAAAIPVLRRRSLGCAQSAGPDDELLNMKKHGNQESKYSVINIERSLTRILLLRRGYLLLLLLVGPQAEAVEVRLKVLCELLEERHDLRLSEQIPRKLGVSELK